MPSILISGLILPGASSSIAAPDPCSLLTTAQASAALSGSASAGTSLASTVCVWKQQGKPGDALLRITITVITVERHNRTKTITAGAVTNVSGLGDDAFYATLNTPNQTNTTLNLRKGNSAVVIRVDGKKSVEEVQAKEKAVAQAILPKL